MKKITIVFLLLTTFLFSQKRSNYLIFKNDTISLKNRDVKSIMDSINNFRQKEIKRINDSIEYMEELHSLYSLYYLDTIRSNTTNKIINIFNEIELAPDEEYIKTFNHKIDTMASLSTINYQVLKLINKLRENSNSNRLEIDSIINTDYIEQSIFDMLRKRKNALMIRDYNVDCNCNCSQEILDYILSYKGVKRKIISDRTKEIRISVLVDFDNNYYIYINIERTINFNYLLKMKS